MKDKASGRLKFHKSGTATSVVYIYTGCACYQPVYRVY